MNNKKWLNFETMFLDLAEALKEYLQDKIIKFEISSCFNCIHFEILCDNTDRNNINQFINEYCDKHPEYI